jgi:hypothetical protein
MLAWDVLIRVTYAAGALGSSNRNVRKGYRSGEHPSSWRKEQRSHMTNKNIVMHHDKHVALVAHDNKKRDLVEWANFNRDLFPYHNVYATGTNGEILERELDFK